MAPSLTEGLLSLENSESFQPASDLPSNRSFHAGCAGDALPGGWAVAVGPPGASVSTRARATAPPIRLRDDRFMIMPSGPGFGRAGKWPHRIDYRPRAL